MNNNLNKYLVALVVLLLLGSVAMDGAILARLPESSSSKMIGTSAGPTGTPPASASNSLPPATADANNGAKDDGPAGDTVSITGMNLSLAPGLSASTTQQDVTAASSWLMQNGFTITQAGTASILFSGSVKAVNTAFGITIHEYTVNGATCYSGVPSSNVALGVPKALGAAVASIALPNSCVPLP